MSLNSLKIATDGYLKRRTKAVLIIAVAGYLNFGSTPPPKHRQPESVFIPNEGGGGKRKEERKKESDELQKLILQEDNEILMFINIFLQCH